MSKVTIKLDGLEATFESEESFATFLRARNGTRPAVRSAQVTAQPDRQPRPASPVQDAVKNALTSGPQTTRQLIETMERNGYTFTAGDKNIAVNSVLGVLEERGEAHTVGVADGNTRQKLWVKGPNV